MRYFYLSINSPPSCDEIVASVVNPNYPKPSFWIYTH